MPDEEKTRRRRAGLLFAGFLTWAARTLPIVNFVAIHRGAFRSRAARATNRARKAIQNVVKFLRTHAVALAASFAGLLTLAILGATLTGLLDTTVPVPSPTGSALLSPPPSSPASSSLIPSPSSTDVSVSSPEPVVTPTPSSSRSPRPTSTPSPSRTPAPVRSSSPTPPAPSATPAPSRTPRPTPTSTPSSQPTPTSTPAPSPSGGTPRPTITPTAGPSVPLPSVRPHDCRHLPRCHKPPKTGAAEMMSIDAGAILILSTFAGFWFARRKVR